MFVCFFVCECVPTHTHTRTASWAMSPELNLSMEMNVEQNLQLCMHRVTAPHGEDGSTRSARLLISRLKMSKVNHAGIFDGNAQVVKLYHLHACVHYSAYHIP